MADFPILGIGGSAGGLEALQALFKSMPRNPGMAFVVVAHLTPTKESHMAKLLGNCTEIPGRALPSRFRPRRTMCA